MPLTAYLILSSKHLNKRTKILIGVRDSDWSLLRNKSNKFQRPCYPGENRILRTSFRSTKNTKHYADHFLGRSLARIACTYYASPVRPTQVQGKNAATIQTLNAVSTIASLAMIAAYVLAQFMPMADRFALSAPIVFAAIARESSTRRGKPIVWQTCAMLMVSIAYFGHTLYNDYFHLIPYEFHGNKGSC